MDYSGGPNATTIIFKGKEGGRKEWEREKTIRRSECRDVRTQLASADCEDGLWGGGGGQEPRKAFRSSHRHGNGFSPGDSSMDCRLADILI